MNTLQPLEKQFKNDLETVVDTQYCQCDKPEPEEIERGEFSCMNCEREIENTRDDYDYYEEEEQTNGLEQIEGISLSTELNPSN